jgi:hypothetical protein
MKGTLADPILRQQLARDLKQARKSERFYLDPQYAYKRNRSLARYLFYLLGLGATLDYVRTLSSHYVVDLGTGTGRAMAELEQSKLGEGLTFVGTGIVWNKSVVLRNYRITPAELMSGFGASSAGAVISVFGPIHYSNHVSLVLEKIDEILVPGGVVKLGMMKCSSLTPARVKLHLQMLKLVEQLVQMGGK